MLVSKTEALPVRSEQDIVKVRRAVMDRASELGFTVLDRTKLVTAASELGRNTLIHGGGGTATLDIVDDGRRKGLRITFTDNGPGIADIDMAMRDGYSTGKGLGLGLGGAKRLVNDFTITSEVGKGTAVSMIRWK